MHEPVPLHRVHETIFEFCRERPDVVIFGAQAVNVYAPKTLRMTEDVDLLTRKPREVADALADVLRERLHIAVRVREVVRGKGFRVYQKRAEGTRHLADVRLLEFELVPVEQLGIRYVPLTELVAMKLVAAARRAGAVKGLTDRADLMRLLAANPHLRDESSGVEQAIATIGAHANTAQARAVWQSLLTEPAVHDDPEWPDNERTRSRRSGKSRVLRKRYGRATIVGASILNARTGKCDHCGRAIRHLVHLSSGTTVGRACALIAARKP